MSTAAVDLETRPLAGDLPATGRPLLGVLRNATRYTPTRVGLVGVGFVLAVALLGPLVAPHSPTAFVGVPNTPPSADAWLGTDQLGRDVLSRVLHGGLSVVWLSAATTVLSIVVGTAIGLSAAYARGWADEAMMRLMDVLLAFPAIVLALLAMSALGSKLWVLVTVVAIASAPYDARVLRSAAQEVLERDFVKAAEASGEGRLRILVSEGLPNLTGVLMVATGLRMTYSVLIISSMSFLGFGLQPPAADWGLMINENRLALTTQPWGVLAPAIVIALFTVAFNLVTDGVARAASGVDRGMRSG